IHMKVARAALLTCVGALACSGSPFRGGYVHSESPRQGGRVLLRFIPGHCEDARHLEQAPRFFAVDVVETDTGRILLFEHRQGYFVLIAENVREEGPFWVFEVVVSGDHVRRWRI